MSSFEEYRIDPRTESDLRAQMAELAHSYTPEWAFDPDKPDIGSVIGLLFASQLAGNIRRLNQVVDKYHTEFINLLDLSLKAALPAAGVAVFDMIPDTVAGVHIPRGVKLLAQGEGDARVVFETQQDVFVTSARLTDLVGVSGPCGSIHPIRGDWRKEPLLPRRLSAADGIKEDASAADGGTDEAKPEFPIALFDYTGENIARGALLLYHSSLFDTAPGVSVLVYAKEAVTGESMAAALCDADSYRWSYLSPEGLTPIAAKAGADGSVVLEKGGDNRHLLIDGTEYAVLCVETVGMPPHTVDLRSIEVSSSCAPTAPDCVIHNDEQLDSRSCLPFGATASIFDECYIGHDRIFRQQGAGIELTFHLEYEDKLVDLLPQQVQEELKIIKRRPRPAQLGRAETCVQRMALEYFNGRGWYRLPCDSDWQTLFDSTHTGEVSIRFQCPEDWRESVMGGVEGRMIRLRVMQADNCFLQPCLHRMPRLRDMRLRYRYVGFRRLPQRVERICGTVREDITAAVQQRQPFTAFAPLPYPENALLLGFDRPFDGAPVSLFFDIEENIHFARAPLQFYYSAAGGFKRLRIVDGTHGMRQSGTVLFDPPEDFAPFPVEGRRRYWLRLTDEAGAFDRQACCHAVIRSILLNAIEIKNIETLPEKQLYIEAAVPNMAFPLDTDNILSAEVFVNEYGALTQGEMQSMLAEEPDNVRAEYNLLGEISAFFVRWTEVDSFDRSAPGERHYVIDRMLSLLRFGDGVNVKIPRAQHGVAVTVRVQRCEGAGGNLPAGTVSSPYRNMMYIDRVYTPVATTAGSSLETVERARLRGTNLISGQDRLVSLSDFKRAVQSYSSVIEKVRCIPGHAPDGRKDARLISIAVMMRDYQQGSYSFHHMKKTLSAYLLSHCEATVSPDDLYLTEPSYITLSVDVWAETAQTDLAFQVQNALTARITAFLDPLGSGSGKGWEIGSLPDEKQIGMMLRTAEVNALVRRFAVHARRVEPDGVHECSLSELPRSPFMIGVNGIHRVHIVHAG